MQQIQSTIHVFQPQITFHNQIYCNQTYLEMIIISHLKGNTAVNKCMKNTKNFEHDSMQGCHEIPSTKFKDISRIFS